MIFKLNCKCKRIIQISLCLLIVIRFIHENVHANYYHTFYLNKYLDMGSIFGVQNNVARVATDNSYTKYVKKCFQLLQNKYRKNTVSVSIDTPNSVKNVTYLGVINVIKSHYFINKTSTKPNNVLCKRFITIEDYQGRIGNQMFQIASLIGIAYKYDITPLIPATFSLNTIFDMPNVENNTSTISNVVKCKEKKYAVYYNCKHEIETGKNISLYGFLQSWKYFYRCLDLIKIVFKIKPKYSISAQKFLSRVSFNGYKSVCIHVRRGDMTSAAHQKKGYTVAGLEFIEKAKQFYKYKYSKVQFIVISDDKAWCRNNIKTAYVSNLSSPAEDLALMILCDDVVVTSGTFGWWGALLSGGTTVFFDQFPRHGSVLASGMNRNDYYPPNWIGIS
ncbi:galactoside 2-alpha-L-fucosyltransferase Sec1-like [Ruditapes philippinarum]|uniref:galactoside 2-alpha-L-fucosyltransferase Sec1-like n=1 Tax=Ruditapes philippinarum TaxID=129788 RepID=UPI00295AEABE|nr:galactoside 2-alpha-L-fucosyltransferase Sec1-like [Ruditapes philippinarum]